MSDHDQVQLCADLSMRRPGFALQKYHAEDKRVEIIRKSHVDNKGTKKTHGQMLSEIAIEQKSYLSMADEVILVRERGFFKFAQETQVLCKVVGVTDLYAWSFGQKVFDEIAPTAVKKLVAGKASADKADIASALEYYVGRQDYACDDESDAVAVGIAWLIQHKLLETKTSEAE